MSGLRNAYRIRSRFGPGHDHDRARRLAVERLDGPLAPADATWLDDHLAGCAPCATVAADHASAAAALRALRDRAPAPVPGDLWARTSAALGSARALPGDAHAGRAAVGGPPLVPAGALAGALVVAVVAASAFLAGGPVAPPATGSPLPTGAADPTALPVAAEAVAWFAPAPDGTYALSIAAVDGVCPDGTVGCPEAAGETVLLRLAEAPRAVVRSPDGRELAVVDAGTAGGGGSVYLVTLPAGTTLAGLAGSAGGGPTPSDGLATPAASPDATAGSSPAATDSATASPVAASPAAPSPTVIDVAAVPSPSVDPTPDGGPSPGGKPTPWPFASPSAAPAASPEPSPSVEPGPSVAPSPSSSATEAPPSASPDPDASPDAGGSPDPDASRVPDDATTAPVPAESPAPSGSPAPATTADPLAGRDWSVAAIATGLVVGETIGFSPDGAWLAFTARPADGSRGHDVWLRRAGEAVARRVTDDGRSVFASWNGPLLVGSRAAFPSPAPVPTPTPAASATAGTGASPSAAPSVRPSTGIPSVDGTPSIADPVTFLIEPASGRRTDLAASAWRPVVDPLGRWAIHWAGRLRFDRASVSWVPADGGFVIGSWVSLISPPATPVPTPAGPSVAPASPDPSRAPSASPSAAASPSASPSAAASPSASPSVPPEPLPGLGELGAVDPVPADWEIRWEPTGLRVAIWVADPLDRRLGRLSLLVLDPWTGRIDPAARLLVDEPALAGISLELGRLAWATPPGQDGLGSRLEVLAWGPDGVGRLDGAPIVERGSVVVVR